MTNGISDPGKLTGTYQKQAALFRALGHPVRIAILHILSDGEQCVCHMEANLRLRQSYISQHLMVLREAGLVQDRRDGWNIYYRLTRSGTRSAREMLRAMPAGIRSKVNHRKAAPSCMCPKCKSPTLRNGDQGRQSQRGDSRVKVE